MLDLNGEKHKRTNRGKLIERLSSLSEEDLAALLAKIK